MNPSEGNTLSKAERLKSKTDISNLLTHGKWGVRSCLKYCVLNHDSSGMNRIMVSVPKKFFKRAVKRNLLKRRIRESYRTQKSLLLAEGADILFYYNTKDIHSYNEIREAVASVLAEINDRLCAQDKL